MLESTKKKKVSGKNKAQRRRRGGNTLANRGDGRLDLKSRDSPELPGKMGCAEGVVDKEGAEETKAWLASAPGRRSNAEAQGDGLVPVTTELKAIETSINGCSMLHD